MTQRLDENTLHTLGHFRLYRLKKFQISSNPSTGIPVSQIIYLKSEKCVFLTARLRKIG